VSMSQDCLTAALAFFKLLNLSPSIQTASKEKELVNKLLGMIPALFPIEAEPRINSNS